MQEEGEEADWFTEVQAVNTYHLHYNIRFQLLLRQGSSVHAQVLRILNQELTFACWAPEGDTAGPSCNCTHTHTQIWIQALNLTMKFNIGCSFGCKAGHPLVKRYDVGLSLAHDLGHHNCSTCLSQTTLIVMRTFWVHVWMRGLECCMLLKRQGCLHALCLTHKNAPFLRIFFSSLSPFRFFCYKGIEKSSIPWSTHCLSSSTADVAGRNVWICVVVLQNTRCNELHAMYYLCAYLLAS